MSLNIFGFRALWSPYFLISLLVITLLYFLLIGPWRHRFSGSEPTPIKTKVMFVLGMVLLYICKGSPIDLLGHIIFTTHMVQMAILYLVIAPLFILGIPNWVWSRIVNQRIIKPIIKLLTSPIIALFLFNGIFSFYHIPFIHDFVKTNVILHASVTSIIFIAAILMWWPLLNKLEGWNNLHGLKKIGYIFADGILITPACALIIFSDAAFYATYTELGAWTKSLELCVPASLLSQIDLSGPDMFTSMSALEDQRTGGVIMKIMQEIIYGIFLAIVFFEWARKERGIDELDEDLMVDSNALNEPRIN
ncbi:cytochrome c oxidase assembly factor CtaG [Fredinandcohnia quinoae]|nr:cytochrome c oxidase assembly factor CtaG [Fredinandcohnia sp. SECRCQ15]